MNKDYPIGSQIELNSGLIAEVTAHSPNPFYLVGFCIEDRKRRKQSIQISMIKQIISNPIPTIGDRLIDEDNEEGVVLSASSKSLEIAKPDKITSHNLELHQPKIKTLKTVPTSKRGGARPNSGRKQTGRQQRKALQIPLDLAQTLPDLHSLSELIAEFRELAESGKLRSENLGKFYKALDELPRIA